MQKCDTCRKACGGCSWTAIDPMTREVRGEPVPGWTAEPTLLRASHGRQIGSFAISACPEYEEDRRKARSAANPAVKPPAKHKRVDHKGIQIMFFNGYTIQEIVRATGHKYDTIRRIGLRCGAVIDGRAAEA